MQIDKKTNFGGIIFYFQSTLVKITVYEYKLTRNYWFAIEAGFSVTR